MTELEQSVTGLETERDFYFGKLRDIEIICQSSIESLPPDEPHPVIDEILKIMYAQQVKETIIVITD